MHRGSHLVTHRREYIMCGVPRRCRGGVHSPKADMCSATRDVRFGPKADINAAEAQRVFVELLAQV